MFLTYLAPLALLICAAVTATAEASPTGACSHAALHTPIAELPRVNAVFGVGREKEEDGSARASARVLSATSASSSNSLRFRVLMPAGGFCRETGQPYYKSDTGTMGTCGADDVLSPDKMQTLNSILAAALRFLSSAYRVSTPITSISVPGDVCGAALLGDTQTVEDADFVLLVSALPQSGTDSALTLAWGKPCARLGSDSRNRPVVGQINFLPALLPSANGVTDLNVHVAMHEITHALGFVSLYTTLASYVDEDGVWQATGGTQMVYRPQLGKMVSLVSTPRVLREARRHFGCSYLDGVEIEDMGGGGTAGAHWKKRILFEEALVGVITSSRLFYSSITLAFFEDAGFYEANYEMAEDEFFWGKDAGCDFLYEKCNTLFSQGRPEFCFGSAKDNRCTLDRLSVGYCDISTFSSPLPSIYQYFGADSRKGGAQPTMDYCPAVTAYENFNCLNPNSAPVQNIYGNEFGPSSRCFESSLVTSGFPTAKPTPHCLRTLCTSSANMSLVVQGQAVALSVAKATSGLFGVHGRIISLPAGEGVTEAQLCTQQLLADSTESAAMNAEFLSSSSLLDTSTESCARRAERCTAAGLERLYPLCQHMASAVRQCFEGCAQQRSEWASSHVRRLCPSFTHLNTAGCLDGLSGQQSLCDLTRDGTASPMDAHLHAGFLLCSVVVLLLFLAF